MRAVLRFLLILIVGLGVLTWVGYEVLTRTTRGWFERDISLRARSVVGSARQSLVRHWAAGDVNALHDLLRELTRDERIMAAAACAPDGRRITATESFPAEFSCRGGGRVEAATQAGNEWTRTVELHGGPVRASGIEVHDGDTAVGTVVLVQDLSYVIRREDKARDLLLLAFGILAIGASIITILAVRLSWRSWTEQMRRALRDRDSPPEYKPLLKDVRDLVQRLVNEHDQDGRGGRWTPERLKSVLGQHLHGERIVIVANREPYVHDRLPDGSIRVLHPASGLVTALEPVMRACSGVWVAHGSGSADRETVDAKNHVMVPPGEGSYALRRVWLSEAEEQGYYYGFANEGLWPLCHVAHNRPAFRASDWEQYRNVNRKFADAVCEEVDTDDPIILVQDYHFALAPKMIRERLPRATIIAFWHIPWPNPERVGICPWRNELLEGLLGSSILGFHTQQHCNNFLEAIDSFLEARIDRERNAIVQGARRTQVRPYPISIEWPVGWLKDLPSAPDCRASVFAELGLPPDALLGVGVDRLDYTKGIEERLLAVERLLERYPLLNGRFTFAQLAAPSRTRIARYRDLNDVVEQAAERINAKYGRGDYQPIRLLRAHHEPPNVFRYYRAADVCYVSSLHDGMNLVAKEFVAARDDEQGVLVLSHFTGAARELTEALIVNPYDLEEASAALALAVQLPVEEQRERMRAMRELVSEFNVYRWAGRMLIDAAQLRRREQLTGRLSHGEPHVAGAG